MLMECWRFSRETKPPSHGRNAQNWELYVSVPRHGVITNLVSYVAKIGPVTCIKSFLVSGGVCGDW